MPYEVAGLVAKKERIAENGLWERIAENGFWERIAENGFWERIERILRTVQQNTLDKIERITGNVWEKLEQGFGEQFGEERWMQ